MKKLMAVLSLTLVLIGCASTSNPKNPAGKIDMSRPVGYVVVSQEEKADTLYIMTGEKFEDAENPQEVDAETDQEEAGDAEEVTE